MKEIEREGLRGEGERGVRVGELILEF